VASKFERWSKISHNQVERTDISPDKTKLLNDFSTVPEKYRGDNIPADASDSVSGKINPNADSSVESGSNNPTPDVGVQNSSTSESGKSPAKSKRGGKQQEGLATKVNNNVRSFIENKVTKEQTHKKTSFLLTLRNLAKLENFDKQHGGRVKGEFINNLLEEAFAELEKDPQWKKVLENDVDRLMEQIGKKR
jgi:hypothetical protein